MEIEILQKEKNDLKLRIEGESHTLANLLCAELNQDESVKVASYTLEHPLKNTVILHIRTEGKSPEKVLSSVAERVVKRIQEIKKELQDAIRRA